MRNKAKVKVGPPTTMEMVIKINNENVVLEVIPPAGMIPQQTDPSTDPLTSPGHEESAPEDEEKSSQSDEEFPADSEEFAGETELNPSDDRKLWHNKSEKIRRGQLRSSMERLKTLVPLEDTSQKYTTVTLLRKAKQLIHKLEEKQKKNVTFRDQLLKEQKYLRKRLDLLQLEVKGQGQPVSSQAPPKTLITAGTASTANKYPANLPLSQTPMILKRSKVSEANNEVILIDNPRVTSRGQALSPPTAIVATVPTVNSQTTYQVVATDQFVSDNFCFILDTSDLQ